MTKGEDPLITPDGRYIIVRGRLWRRTDPRLTEAQRTERVADLMAARRAVAIARRADNDAAEDEAHKAVDRAKRALGERGAVWWSDGAPDLTRHLAKNTLYADWYASLAS